MDLIKCRICGSRHRLGAAHVWPEPPRTPKRKSNITPVELANKPEDMRNSTKDMTNLTNTLTNKPSLTNKPANPSATYRYREAEKWRRYMRDYMRQKRAKVSDRRKAGA